MFRGWIRTEDIPWFRLRARVTKRFTEHVSRLTAITTNQEAGWFLGLDDEVVYRIDKEILQKQYEERLIPPPAAVNISIKDENNELIELINCKQRFILLKAKDRLTQRQANYLDRLCKINEPIYKAMLLREIFLRFMITMILRRLKSIL
jgi:hypothetical protein